MGHFFVSLFAFSGTALGLMMFLVGWFLQRVISDKSKVLSWVVFALFIVLGGLCFALRAYFSQLLA